MKKPFIVHEWGTFLAVSGSDGVSLEGMSHEEHPLPTFVHTSPQDSTFSKLFTLKGETPVIYFYTDRLRKVRVGVDFPTGIWTHWFPSAVRVGRFPSPHANQNGHIGWVAHIAPPSSQDRLPKIASDSLWRFARQVPQAATVQMTASALLLEESGSRTVAGSGETERFLFYRGLGQADLPVRFSPKERGGSLSTTVAVRTVLVVRVAQGKISWCAVERLWPGQKLEGVIQRLKPGTVGEIAQRLMDGLIAHGLFPDEARALVNTWRISYVEHEGLRVLFILPQSWTETFIPMQVLPKPDQLVRVMVGRIEGLTVEREAQVAEAVQGFVAHPDAHFATLVAQGRYLEPILRRLAIRPELRASCEKWLATEFVQTGKGTAAALHKQLTL